MGGTVTGSKPIVLANGFERKSPTSKDFEVNLLGSDFLTVKFDSGGHRYVIYRTCIERDSIDSGSGMQLANILHRQSNSILEIWVSLLVWSTSLNTCNGPIQQTNSKAPDASGWE